MSRSNSQYFSRTSSLKFWELEEVPRKTLLSKEEQNFEEHFLANFPRNKEGRYEIKLPFNDNKKKLEDSRFSTSRRLNYLNLNLVKRFEKSPKLKKKLL